MSILKKLIFISMKVTRLTESDINRLVSKVLKEEWRDVNSMWTGLRIDLLLNQSHDRHDIACLKLLKEVHKNKEFPINRKIFNKYWAKESSSLGVLGKTSDYLSWVLTKQIIRRYLGNNYIEH